MHILHAYLAWWVLLAIFLGIIALMEYTMHVTGFGNDDE